MKSILSTFWFDFFPIISFRSHKNKKILSFFFLPQSSSTKANDLLAEKISLHSSSTLILDFSLPPFLFLLFFFFNLGSVKGSKLQKKLIVLVSRWWWPTESERDDVLDGRPCHSCSRLTLVVGLKVEGGGGVEGEDGYFTIN